MHMCEGVSFPSMHGNQKAQENHNRKQKQNPQQELNQDLDQLRNLIWELRSIGEPYQLSLSTSFDNIIEFFHHAYF